MKRSQPEPSTSAPAKKQATTKIFQTVSIGPVSTEEEMNTKVLLFQNKKLAERLDILKLDEERLKERFDDVKQKRDSDFEILSVINRHWTQLDEDITIMHQSYVDGTVEEEFGDQSDTAMSYLEHLSHLDQEQIKEEVMKRAANSKQCIRKLLSLMEKARCFPPRPIRAVATKAMQTVVEQEFYTSNSMEVDEPKECLDDKAKVPEEWTSDSLSEPVSKLEPALEPTIVDRDTELEELKEENRRLRELMTSLQQKQQTTSLEFSEIRDKYALTQREISELNTQLQDSEYDLQKANHRVENLVKRLHELEDMKKKIREGEIPSKRESSSEGQEDDDEEKHSEFMEVKELANNRLEELQKLKEECVNAQQEVEKLKLEAIQIPESTVVQTSPYKCLQSQFSVLFNEVTTSRQQLDDVRRSLSAAKTQHMVQLEQIETEMTTTHKKYKSEVNELHDALLHCKREYDLLRIEYEQLTKSNEQSAPMIKEVSYMNNSLQSYNKQLKGEIMRYKRKLSEAQAQTQKLEAELTKMRETEKKEMQEKKEKMEQKTEEEMEVKQEEETKTTPKEPEGGEEGELEEGEEEEEEPSTSNDSERLKQLQASLKKSQESQKEMKLLLDVYKGAAKDLRDKVELLASEKTLKTEIEELQKRVQELEQELEKYKGAMADEEAIRRLKMAEETIVQLQKNLAATKQEEDALLAEMEFTGQEYVEMQEQNMRLLQQLREKDDANLKLMSERIKSNQIQKQIREEKDVLADQVTSLNAYRETQTQLIKKQEERERALQSALGSMEKELNLRQQAMELHKRKALDSVQAVQDLKIRLEAFQQQQQEVQQSIADKTRNLEEEAFRAKRVQEECNSLKRKLEKQKKIDLYGAADEILLEEVRQYKARLTCPCCNTRKKDAILTKCYHVFCFECLKTRYDTRQRKCPKCNATFGNNDFHKIYL